MNTNSALDNSNWKKKTCKYCGRVFEYFTLSKEPVCCGSLRCEYEVAMAKINATHRQSNETFEQYKARVQHQVEIDINEKREVES